MTDLTKITTPFGLLDEETQAALKAHGGPYEIFIQRGWIDTSGDQDFSFRHLDCSFAVRVKPTPPKPREVTGVWNSRRGCFEVYVTNVDYPHGMEVKFTGVLP